VIRSSQNWRKFLRSEDEEKYLERLRQHSRTGRPLGDEAFVASLEKRLGRRLAPAKGGRPRKKEN
jgi:putative transposase